MQRLSIIVLCVAMVTLGTIASQAQGSSIASVIEQRSNSGLEFTTLQRFIDASDLENNLSSTGSYTLFAPTDAAFERLERAINYTTEQLLSNQEIINAMVRYHTVESRLSASQLRARDGRVIATELPNAFVGITRADDNTIVVNNVVEITDENISASNGIIHEINDVLLNRVINDLLDEAFGTPATATPTPSPTSTPPATTTPTSQTRSTANVRVLHLAMDAPEMTIQLDSMTVIETLAYQDFSDFSNVSQGIYTARA
ncbi:MAG: fasciclin domain-containing protein, partial [Chloroflexota bacterium]